MMFEVHRLNVIGFDKADKLRVVFQTALDGIEAICATEASTLVGQVGARELAIVRTKLEEASFFAKRAMALCPENQEKA